MVRRGDALREHILDSAKLAFLETGFERTSMDAIAARAETSKRSLYAYFPTKDQLFLAVVERIRLLFADRLHTPAYYDEDPMRGLVHYCGRLVQLLSWSSVTLTARLGIAEAERVPELAAGLYDALFGVPVGDLAAHVREHWQLSEHDAVAISNQLIGLATHPALPRLLFGLDPIRDELPDEVRLDAEVDLERIREFAWALLPDRGDG